jgi:hypothetical protein
MRIAFPQSRPRSALAAALFLIVLSLAASAPADTGTNIINRCTHGQSLSGFSQADYRRALAELPTEVEEYSDCANLIRHAQLAAAGGGGSPSSSGGGAAATAIPVTPAERKALNHIASAGAAPQRVGGLLVRPGVVHADIASAISSMPESLLAVLVFLLACAFALGGRAIRNGIRAHRSS